jgi:hypothetical protein
MGSSTDRMLGIDGLLSLLSFDWPGSRRRATYPEPRAWCSIRAPSVADLLTFVDGR